jgi:hypothetical protein
LLFYYGYAIVIIKVIKQKNMTEQETDILPVNSLTSQSPEEVARTINGTPMRGDTVYWSDGSSVEERKIVGFNELTGDVQLEVNGTVMEQNRGFLNALEQELLAKAFAEQGPAGYDHLFGDNFEGGDVEKAAVRPVETEDDRLSRERRTSDARAAASAAYLMDKPS